MVADLTMHGGDIYTYLEETGKEPLDYSANINPLGLPLAVKKALCDNLDSYCDYPDIKCRKLKKAVAQYEQIEEDWLAFGNGAADLIYRICYALKPKKALIPAPTFLEYEQALSCVDCKVEYYHLKAENRLLPDEQILGSIKGKDIVFLCNPNNPTGKVVSKELLLKIALKCKEENCILVIDECFMDFVTNKEQSSFICHLSDFHNVIILKAFTKIFAMPGLRLGYSMSTNQKLLEKIEKAGQSWSVSVPAQIAGLAALQDMEYLKSSVELINKERKYLLESLRALGITAYESDTNFILIQTEQKNLYQKLYEQGILIRKCHNFVGLDHSFYRIAVKDHEKNERFIRAITRAISET